MSLKDEGMHNTLRHGLWSRSPEQHHPKPCVLLHLRQNLSTHAHPWQTGFHLSWINHSMSSTVWLESSASEKTLGNVIGSWWLIKMNVQFCDMWEHEENVFLSYCIGYRNEGKIFGLNSTFFHSRILIIQKGEGSVFGWQFLCKYTDEDGKETFLQGFSLHYPWTKSQIISVQLKIILITQMHLTLVNFCKCCTQSSSSFSPGLSE